MSYVYVWFSLNSILIGHFNHSNRIRNEKVMAKIRKLVKIGNRASGVPVHFGQKLPEPKVYRYRLKVYRYTLPENAQNVYFLPFFMHFHPWITPILPTHIKIIPYCSCNLFSTQFLFQYLSYFKNISWNPSKTILIWVTSHT